MGTSKKKTARLIVKKETLRELRSLSDDQLRAAAGAVVKPPPPPALPSCRTC